MNRFIKLILKIILGLFFYIIPFIILLGIVYTILFELFHIDDDGFIIGIPLLISLLLGTYLNYRLLKEVKKKFFKILIIVIQIVVSYTWIVIVAYNITLLFLAMFVGHSWK